MDLRKLRPLDFRRRLDDLESQAITVRKRRNDALIRLGAGGAAGAGTMTLGMMLAVALMNTIVAWPLWLGLPIFLLMMVAVTAVTMGAAGRYLAPSERRLLPAVLEPDAADFLEDNWQRRDRLLEEAEAFDDALQALRALPERTGEEAIDVGVVINLAERRARFEAEAEKYFADFRAATEEERKRVAAANVPRKRLASPHRQSLRDFKRKVRLLAELERSLEGLSGSVASGTIVDLSPHLAAQRFRAELEEERATLIRCGLKPKKLPKLRINRKFLPPGK